MCILVAILPPNSFTSETETETTRDTINNRTKFKNTLQKIARGKPYKTTFTNSTALGSYGGIYKNSKSQSWKYCSDGINLDNLLRLHSTATPNYCQGAFAFVAVHPIVGLIVARDSMGMSPLHIGIEGDETWFASELKALEHCSWHNAFPIGSKYDATSYSIIDPFVERYNRNIFNLLLKSTNACINIGVPWGVLLSGGLHSSIIASITRFCDRPRGYPVLHTFSIGLEDNIDSIELIAARKIAREVRSVHHNFTFTIEEGLNTMTEAIYVAETQDITTICKCIPMILLAKHVSNAGIKVVLSGLGASEVFYEGITGSIINKCMQMQGVKCLTPFVTTSIIDMVNTGITAENMKILLKDCLPKNYTTTVPNPKWVQACEEYGENKIRLMYNTIYPGH